MGYGSDPFLDEREIYPEWFVVDTADQCDDVPENVNTGRIRDVCGDVSRCSDRSFRTAALSVPFIALLSCRATSIIASASA